MGGRVKVVVATPVPGRKFSGLVPAELSVRVSLRCRCEELVQITWDMAN
jgi:hypothetical protein